MASMVALAIWVATTFSVGGACSPFTADDLRWWRATQLPSAEERLAQVGKGRKGLCAYLALEALHDPDARVRRAALDRALRYRWHQTPPTAPLELVGDSNVALRVTAVESLTSFRLTRASVDALWRSLDDAEASVRAAARDGLRLLLPDDAHGWRGALRTHESEIRSFLALAMDGPSAWDRHIADSRAAFRRVIIEKIAHGLRCTCQPWHDDLAPKHIRWLCNALCDADSAIRGDALNAVASIRPTWEHALPRPTLRLALRAFLRDEDPDRRVTAIEAVARFLAPLDAVPLLVARASDSSGKVREAAIRALGNIGAGDPRAAAAVVRAVHDPAAWWHALDALPSVGSKATAVRVDLLRTVEDADEDTHVRKHALVALSKIGLPDADALQGVIRLLDDEDLFDEVVRAIGRYNPGDAASIATIVSLLSRRGERAAQIHLAALRSLSRAGPNAARALPAVRDFLCAADIDVVKFHAEMAISSMGNGRRLREVELAIRHAPLVERWISSKMVPASDRVTIDEAFEASAHPSVRIRRWALRSLRELELTSCTPAQVRTLAARLGDPDEDVCDLAVFLLTWARPTPRAALPALAGLLARDGAALIRTGKPRLGNWLECLRRLGPAPASLAGLLRRMFEADVTWAGDALVAIGTPALVALPRDVACVPIADRCRWIRLFARFGSAAIPRIRSGLRSPSPTVRLETLEALLDFGDATRPLARDIVPLLADPMAQVRAAAAAVLGAMKPTSALTDLAGPSLRPLLHDRFRLVRDQAEKTLARMR